jgi:hypothetical protein
VCPTGRARYPPYATPFRSVCACLGDSQLPARTPPMDLALFTRWMPAASPGANILTMMDDDPAFFQRYAPGVE